jgi:hypothetical protein
VRLRQTVDNKKQIEDRSDYATSTHNNKIYEQREEAKGVVVVMVV